MSSAKHCLKSTSVIIENEENVEQNLLSLTSLTIESTTLQFSTYSLK